MKIKVLVVDDNAGLVGLIREYFTDSKDIEIVGSASNGEEAVDIYNFRRKIMILKVKKLILTYYY